MHSKQGDPHSMYRLYSWEHSYFSGKIRAYLRFKQRCGALGPGFEDILATPDLIAGRLIPKSGSNAIPQLEAPDGTWTQDTSEIIDVVEARHPTFAVIPDAGDSPRQRLASYLIELLADEWIVVPAFWQRWFYSEHGADRGEERSALTADGRFGGDQALSHRAFNEQQWGAVVSPGAEGSARRAAGGSFFDAAFGITETRKEPKAVYAGLNHLGCGEKTERAWQASQHGILEVLERLFSKHDYLLGGRPSLGDYGLLGPLYAHLYRDAVPGFYLRTHFPVLTEWIERANGESALNVRQFGQQLYSLDDQGELVGRTATSDSGEWLAGDAIPDDLSALLKIFFDEMWPVLRDSAATLRRFIESDAHTVGDELPGKTFTATPQFIALQTGDGPLTIPFKIGGIESRRMVVPYQIWMWQRVLDANLEDVGSSKESSQRDLLAAFLREVGGEGADAFLDFQSILGPYRIRKDGGRIFSEA